MPHAGASEYSYYCVQDYLTQDWVKTKILRESRPSQNQDQDRVKTKFKVSSVRPNARPLNWP